MGVWQKRFGCLLLAAAVILSGQAARATDVVPAAADAAAPVAVTVDGAVAWALMAGFLVMFMQAGFAMVETGLCRAKNAAHTMSMIMMIYALGCLGFWAYGFALGWGNLVHTSVAAAPGWSSSFGAATAALNRGWGLGAVTDAASGAATGAFHFGLVGLRGFFLHGLDDPGVLALFFLMMTLMTTSAAIATGALAERWRWKNFCLYGLWAALPFGLFANWTWGGGWLAQMGVNWRLGHGAVDFAGSGVVHAMGGIVGLVGVMVAGPRIGKYSPEGKPLPIPAHHLPMVVVGTLILAFGWFGFTSGSAAIDADVRLAPRWSRRRWPERPVRLPPWPRCN